MLKKLCQWSTVTALVFESTHPYPISFPHNNLSITEANISLGTYVIGVGPNTPSTFKSKVKDDGTERKVSMIAIGY